MKNWRKSSRWRNAWDKAVDGPFRDTIKVRSLFRLNRIAESVPPFKKNTSVDFTFFNRIGYPSITAFIFIGGHLKDGPVHLNGIEAVHCFFVKAQAKLKMDMAGMDMDSIYGNS